MVNGVQEAAAIVAREHVGSQACAGSAASVGSAATAANPADDGLVPAIPFSQQAFRLPA
jgi:hypothetical protein